MKNFILLIDGPMGAGKTTVTKILHEKVKNTAHIGLDRIKWFVSGFKRTRPQNAMTRAVVFAMTKEYIKQGVNVIIEQGIKNEQVDKYKKLTKKLKVNFFMFQLEAPKEVLLKRVASRIPTPGRIKVSKARVLRNYKAYYEK
jgi:predicted kinase